MREAVRSKLTLLLVVGWLVPGCDCFETTDVVRRVEPATDCLRLEAESPGNECRMPHLRGTNSCPVPVTFAQGTAGPNPRDVVVEVGATFDYVIQVTPQGNPPTATIEARVGTTPIRITLAQLRR